MSKICYKCHKKNSDEYLFCQKCGTRLEITCPSCGEKSEGGNYCSMCGTQLIESNLSKAFKKINAVYHQSLKRQCTCGENNKTNVKYCTKCGKRLYLTHLQKQKILMNTIIIIVCISLTPLLWNTIKWLSRSTVSDSEGNVYRTVRIGDQLWMNDNLRSSRIEEYPIAKDAFTSKEDAYIYTPCGDSNNVAKLGYFYNWSAASGGIKHELYHHQGICPPGWHLPSTDDIEKLHNSGKHLKSSNGKKDELYWSSSGKVFSNQGTEYNSYSPIYSYSYSSSYSSYSYSVYYHNSLYSNAYDYFSNDDKCDFYETDDEDSRGHYVRCVRDKTIK